MFDWLGLNKLVAKIARTLRKPDGLIVVEERDVKDFLAPYQQISCCG